MAHVFIVNEKTFPVHLRYAFAGTGAKDFSCEFLNSNRFSIQSTRERLLAGMIADISRIRPGDDVLFYLQQGKTHEGMFFGSCKVASPPFLANDGYLTSDLEKNLTFRVLLTPDNLYSKGVSERDCLDSLDGIAHPYEMCWSLIYRKLKGNRGCTMITDYEYEKIMSKIRERNSSKPLSSAQGYDFDADKCLVINGTEKSEYNGRKSSLDVRKRLLYKMIKGNAYESYLQAYLMQNLEEIDCLRVADSDICWIGNEVSCGVGMQSIDVLFIQVHDGVTHFVVCELKDEQPEPYIIDQLQKYVDWLNDYLAPLYSDGQIAIHPTIIAPFPTSDADELVEQLRSAKITNSNPLRYIGFGLDKSRGITFNEIISE